MDEEKFRKTLLYVLDLLVRGEYQALETLSRGRRLTAQEMQETVVRWPYRLVMPPDNDLSDIVYGEIKNITGSNPIQWATDVKLWTAEEGWSDLTLSLTLTNEPGDLYDVEIDNLHVL